MKQIVLILCAVLFVTGAHAASFDCSKANTKIEKMICEDPELSELDSEMERAYKNVLDVDRSNSSRIVLNQKIWLKQTRNTCDDEFCLKRVYVLRIDQLSAPLAHIHRTRAFIKSVTVKTGNGAALMIDNPNERNASFNGGLEGDGNKGKIEECRMLIDVPVGTAHGNHSYGGFCTLLEDGKTSNLMICDDEMVGHFATVKVDHGVSMQDLVNFVVSNCYGG